MFFFSSRSQWTRGLTVFAAGVEVPDGVVEADSDRGEAHLPLQTCHQPVVQRPGPLCPDHGADGAKHASVADAFHRRLLSLNLQGRKGQRSKKALQIEVPAWFGAGRLHRRY